jgi:hypothetical protein
MRKQPCSIPKYTFFPPHDTTEPSGSGDLHYRDLTNTLRHITLGRNLTTHNTHNRKPSMSPARFEPAIPASERPKNHALDRAANGIGFQSIYVLVNFLYVFAWKFTWVIKGLSGCRRLGPSGLCHRIVLVVNRRFKETYSLHFHSPWKRKQQFIPKKVVTTSRTTTCQDPKHRSLNTQHREKLNFYVGQDGA